MLFEKNYEITRTRNIQFNQMMKIKNQPQKWQEDLVTYARKSALKWMKSIEDEWSYIFDLNSYFTIIFRNSPYNTHNLTEFLFSNKCIFSYYLFNNALCRK